MAITTTLHTAAEQAARGLAERLVDLRVESSLTEEREEELMRQIKDRIHLLNQWIGD
jgi:SHS2 domain-containing protein